MNYFSQASAAERYAKGRPYFHADTMKRIKHFLQLNNKVANALDVACGTGLSTEALVEVAENVHGTDPSAEMLSRALLKDKISYTNASADRQPFPDGFFDIITVSCGVHWFGIDAFLAEANRLLKGKGWLVIYDNFFLSEMEHVPAFNNWYPDVFLKRFPAPKRNDDYDWTNENLVPQKMELVEEQRFINPVSFSREELVLYLTTQSNIIAAVEHGLAGYEETEAWLFEELSPFFSSMNKRTLNFGNWIRFIQRMD